MSAREARAERVGAALRGRPSSARRGTRPRSRRAARGLTLLELLVASALMALFFIALFEIVWSTIRTRDMLDEKATPFANGPTVMQRICDDLYSVQIDAIKDGDAFHAEEESVSGIDCTRLDFITTAESRDEVEIRDMWVRAQINEVGYRCFRSESEGGLLALYRREDFAVDDEPLKGGRYYKLCDRVKEFRVDLFGEDPDDPRSEDAKGETEWDAKKEKKLPWGCRVTLVLLGPPPADTDESDRPPEFAFQTFVAFRSRYEKAPAK